MHVQAVSSKPVVAFIESETFFFHPPVVLTEKSSVETEIDEDKKIK